MCVSVFFFFLQFPLIVSVMLLCFGAALKAKVCWISVLLYSGVVRTLPPIEHYPRSPYNSSVFCLKKGDLSQRQYCPLKAPEQLPPVADS